jgi:hypothetical protein
MTKPIQLNPFGKTGIFVVLYSGILLTQTIAQPGQLKITDFVLFGGRGNIPAGTTLTTPLSPGFGVQLGSSSNIVNGNIGSFTLVKSTGNASLGGNIHSGGSIDLTNGNSVNGSIFASQSLVIGSNAFVAGNIDVNASISIVNGQIKGAVTHPVGTFYTGPVPGGGEFKKAPSIPALPEMPRITNFVAPVNTNITTTKTLTPGTYGNIKLKGNQTITFKGAGIYILKSIKNTGTNSIIFDFENKATGNFKVYIEGDVDLNKSNASTINGGDPARIYFETHGKGTTSANGTVAWNIANGAGEVYNWLDRCGRHLQPLILDPELAPHSSKGHSGAVRRLIYNQA